MLDFRILEKRPAAFRGLSASSSVSELALSEMIYSSGSARKRSFVADENDELGPELRKMRSAGTTGRNDDGVIMFLRPTADPLVFPLPTAFKGKQVAVMDGHPLLDLQKGDTVELPAGCEMDCYRLTKGGPIASTSLSAVFMGTTDHPDVPPESVITVKVLKTRAPHSAGGEMAKPHDNERNLIRQADVWLREFESHEGPGAQEHRPIVRR